MLNSLIDLNFDPMVSNLLYGNTKHSKQVNINSFEIIQNYIAETGSVLMVIYTKSVLHAHLQLKGKPYFNDGILPIKKALMLQMGSPAEP